MEPAAEDARQPKRSRERRSRERQALKLHTEPPQWLTWLEQLRYQSGHVATPIAYGHLRIRPEPFLVAKSARSATFWQPRPLRCKPGPVRELASALTKSSRLLARAGLWRSFARARSTIARHADTVMRRARRLHRDPPRVPPPAPHDVAGNCECSRSRSANVIKKWRPCWPSATSAAPRGSPRLRRRLCAAGHYRSRRHRATFHRGKHSAS